jgi:hypothetical protein
LVLAQKLLNIVRKIQSPTIITKNGDRIFSITHVGNQFFQAMTKFFGVVGLMIAFDCKIKFF